VSSDIYPSTGKPWKRLYEEVQPKDIPQPEKVVSLGIDEYDRQKKKEEEELQKKADQWLMNKLAQRRKSHLFREMNLRDTTLFLEQQSDEKDRRSGTKIDYIEREQNRARVTRGLEHIGKDVKIEQLQTGNDELGAALSEANAKRVAVGIGPVGVSNTSSGLLESNDGFNKKTYQRNLMRKRRAKAEKEGK
jgi:hypothetical protein